MTFCLLNNDLYKEYLVHTFIRECQDEDTHKTNNCICRNIKRNLLHKQKMNGVLVF